MWKIFFLIILGGISCHSHSDQSVSRLNYGVVFRHHQSIRVTQSLWRATFRIKLPSMDPSKDSFAFESSLLGDAIFNNLAAFNNITASISETSQSKFPRVTTPSTPTQDKFFQYANFIRGISRSTLRTLHSLGENIKNTLPRTLPPNWLKNDKKTTRALLGFVSELGKSLFGFATETDVNAVRIAVNELILNFNKEQNLIKSRGDHLATFATQVNSQFKNLNTKIEEHEKRTLLLLRQQQVREEKYMDLFAKIVLQALEVVEAAAEMVAFYTNFLGGVESLAAGRLPTFLVPQAQLIETLQHIIDMLQDTRWTIIHLDPQFYYSHANFIHVRDADYLYITLQIPLANIDTLFKIFDILVVPLPTTDQNKHSTKVIGLPEAIAIDESQTYFFELSLSELQTLDKKHASEIRRVFQTFQNTSCVLSLYRGKSPAIMQTCQFQIEIDNPASHIIQLSDSEFFLSNIENYVVSSFNGSAVTSSCRSCIVTLRQGETLSSSKFFVSDSLAGGLDGATRHVTNLALLHAFFNKDSLILLAANSYELEEVEILTPNLTVYEHPLADRDASSSKLTLDLEKTAQQIKNDDIVAASLTHAVLLDNIETGAWAFWVTIPGIVIEISLVTIVFLCFAVVHIFIRLRRLMVAVLVLQTTITPTTGKLVFDFYINGDRQQIQGQSVNNITNIFSFIDLDGEPGSVMILLFLTAMTVGLIIYKIFKFYSKFTKKHEFTLAAKLVSKSDTALLNLITLQGTPEDYKFEGLDFITDIHVLGYFKKFVKYVSPSIRIIHSDLGVEYRLSGKSMLPLGTSSLFTKILASDFACFPVFVENGRVTRMTLRGDCATLTA